MRFHNADDGLCRNETAQRFHADFWRGADSFCVFYQRRRVDSFGVRNFDNLAALTFHDGVHVFADSPHSAAFPVVPVNDVVGFQFDEVWNVTPVLLHDDF